MVTETTFGIWLRQQRRQMDWTQVELAQRVGYSVATIRKLERDELRPSKHLAELLAHELDVALTQHASLVSFARPGPTQGLEPVAQPLHEQRHSNLPAQLTPFFGRTAEIVELIQYLTTSGSRLITIVGPGGMGKTRLALEVAQAILDLHNPTGTLDNPKSKIQNPKYEDGVYFVALAPLRAPEHIVPAIAEAISLRFQGGNRLPKAQLFDYLRHKQVLLVLDNFEHLQTGTELILELLQECPGLRLLVTSREHLQLSSETRFVLESMALPTTAVLPDVLSYSAIRLFVETACRMRPKFTLSPANAQAIVRVCQLVDGIPLGIILAAAWVEVLSPAEIVTELSQGFDFLAAELRDLPERQRSMRAVLTQSWQRLTDTERAVFMRLAVFRGGFTRPAAQTVAGASLRMLSTLVNKSLVQCEPSGRYTIHELLRQFAEAELEADAQMTDARAAHCVYFIEYLQQAPDLKGRHQEKDWYDQLEYNHDNLRAALQWSLTANLTLALCLAGALGEFWHMRGYYSEGRSWLNRALGQYTDTASLAQGWALRKAGKLAIAQGDYAEATALFEISLEVYHTLEDEEGIGSSLNFLGVAALHQNDLQKAEQLFEQSLVFRRRLNEYENIAASLHNLSLVAMCQHNFPLATAFLDESFAILRSDGFADAALIYGTSAGYLKLYQEDVANAVAHFRKAISLALEERDRRTIVHCVEGLAYTVSLYGIDKEERQQAIYLLSAADALSIKLGIPRRSIHRSLHDKSISAIRAQISEVDFALAWDEGQKISPEQAIAYSQMIEIPDKRPFIS